MSGVRHYMSGVRHVVIFHFVSHSSNDTLNVGGLVLNAYSPDR